MQTHAEKGEDAQRMRIGAQVGMAVGHRDVAVLELLVLGVQDQVVFKEVKRNEGHE